jgi:hypothetical protein
MFLKLFPDFFGTQYTIGFHVTGITGLVKKMPAGCPRLSLKKGLLIRP